MSDAGQNRNMGLLALFSLFILIWLAGWYMERFDYVNRLPVATIGYLQPFVDQLAPRAPFLTQLFSLRVLRHLIPAVLGWFLARSAALGLIAALFDLPDRRAAQLFLQRSQSGANPPGRPVPIRRAEFEKDRLQQPLLRYGGPGRVQVEQGDVIWTERNGRYQRVLGAGTHVLERYEYVRGVLDLRPQERGETKVRVTTKDGIELRVDVALTYQIDRGDRPPTERDPYPLDEEAIRRACYTGTVLSDGHLAAWDTLPLRVVVRQLREIVGRRTLDALLFRQDNRPLEDVSNRLEREGKRALQKHGVNLLTVRLGRLEIPDQVVQQRIEHWQALWHERRRRRAASGSAEALVQVEKARAEAKANAIRRILEGMREAQQTLRLGGSREMVALRLVDALERITRQSSQTTAPTRELTSRIDRIKREISDQEMGSGGSGKFD